MMITKIIETVRNSWEEEQEDSNSPKDFQQYKFRGKRNVGKFMKRIKTL